MAVWTGFRIGSLEHGFAFITTYTDERKHFSAFSTVFMLGIAILFHVIYLSFKIYPYIKRLRPVS
jgi:hypothetical protein